MSDPLEGVRRTAGAFDPSRRHIYFCASNIDQLPAVEPHHENILIAVNELRGEEDIEKIEGLIERGARVFIDSGIFNLTMKHSRANNVSMDEALALPPDRIDGFYSLFDRYCEIIDRLGDSCWGYIELDQGGRENKIQTRERLEELGFRPIPVYHPLNDGWEYFDYLAQRYDRICLGNLVKAIPSTRLALLATVWERAQAYPHLWIHALGVTPSPPLVAYPVHSCDSSSWTSGTRWGDKFADFIATRRFGELPDGFRYLRGSERDSDVGRDRAVAMLSFMHSELAANWRQMIEDYQALEVTA